MAEQREHKRRIEYIMALTELLCSGDHVALCGSDISLDGCFTDSELRLFAALRDVWKDENSALNKPHGKHVEFKFKV